MRPDRVIDLEETSDHIFTYVDPRLFAFSVTLAFATFSIR